MSQAVHVSIAHGLCPKEGKWRRFTLLDCSHIPQPGSSHSPVLSLSLNQAASAGIGSHENTSLLEGWACSIGAWACSSRNELWFPVISLQLPLRLNYSSGCSLPPGYQVITTWRYAEYAFFTSRTGTFVLGPPGHAFKYLDEERLAQSWAGRCVVPADGFIHHTWDVWEAITQLVEL